MYWECHVIIFNSKILFFLSLQLQTFIRELERQRTSSSLPLSEEKEILRQISQIQKAKVAYEETKVHEQLIKEKKVSEFQHLLVLF